MNTLYVNTLYVNTLYFGQKVPKLKLTNLVILSICQQIAKKRTQIFQKTVKIKGPYFWQKLLFS